MVVVWWYILFNFNKSIAINYYFNEKENFIWKCLSDAVKLKDVSHSETTYNPIEMKFNYNFTRTNNSQWIFSVQLLLTMIITQKKTAENSFPVCINLVQEKYF